jgi:predicted ATPase/transcriptional regulator with XRE-family HTH domain
MVDKSVTTFGELLSASRQKKGLSQNALAKAVSVDNGQLSKVERGLLPPFKREKILQLAGVLQLSLKETNTLLLNAGYAPAARAGYELEALFDLPPQPLIFQDRRTIREANVDDAEIETALNQIRTILKKHDLTRQELDDVAEDIAWYAASMLSRKLKRRATSIEHRTTLGTLLVGPNSGGDATPSAANPEEVSISDGVAARVAPVQEAPDEGSLLTDTPLIGRDREQKQIFQLLQDASKRVITLRGPRGSGKSRLALELASSRFKAKFPGFADQFQEGVIIVDLSYARDRQEALSTLALQLGINPDFEVITRYLASKRILLILDNVQHVRGISVLVAGLVMSTKHVKVLTTSIESLYLHTVTNETLKANDALFYQPNDFPTRPSDVLRALPSEEIIDVSPLNLPKLRDLTGVGPLDKYDSVVLFRELMKLIEPGFQLTDEAFALIGGICQGVEGYPLAIELVVGQVGSFVSLNSLDLEKLREDLKRHHSEFVRQPGQTPPERLLMAVIDWSYQCLSSEERAVLNRVAVFRSKWTVTAADYVCSDGVADTNIESVLRSLARKRLVRVRTDNYNKEFFSMHEMIREYALRQLRVIGEIEEQYRRHANYYLELAQRAELRLKGREQVKWLQNLKVERGNLEAALMWFHRHEMIDEFLRLAVALFPFWEIKGRFTEGRNWLRMGLESGGYISNDIRARACKAAGILAHCQSDFDKAEQYLKDSVRINQEIGDFREARATANHLARILTLTGHIDQARALANESLEAGLRLNDERLIASSYDSLGLVERHSGDPSTAQEFFRRCLIIARRLQDKWRIAIILDNLGALAIDTFDLDAAKRYLEESRRLKQELEDTRGLGFTHTRLASLYSRLREYDQAIEHAQESLATWIRLGDKWGEAESLNLIGMIELVKERYRPATQYFVASLQIMRVTGEHAGGRVVAESLEGLAQTAAKLKNPGCAAFLWGMADKTRKIAHARIAEIDKDNRNTAITQVRQQLNKALWKKAWIEGNSIENTKDIIDEALKNAVLCFSQPGTATV